MLPDTDHIEEHDLDTFQALYGSLFIQDVARHVECFAPADLLMLDSLELLKRYDTKFVIADNLLQDLLSGLYQYNYSILEINHDRVFNYVNQYFDTAGHEFYNQHHNGKLNRAKVRYRHYTETGDCFFEIKRRTNNRKTIKDRLRTQKIERKISGGASVLVGSILGINPLSLKPALVICYKRITLINPAVPEKITVDTDISFRDSRQEVALPGLALVEIKQRKVCSLTPSFQLLKSLNCHPAKGLSKYCLGMVMTDSGVKYNRFKAKLMIINKIMRNRHGYKFFF